eukprot:TRINITY_DN37455_c0_g1_i1.p1 TRINITY_DN37455_c0_g1~~TRINITY_DN37455_c0_g1_i1.p1  ORF type:complete len:428 (-),score=98.05 TRINITY_DN37455_c0_g1_i1:82-1365(-)
MGQNSSKDVEIKGTVSPGFEPVKAMFTENFHKGREESAQLCVYVGEEKVVDLWGSTTLPTYTADTLTNVFSSTKSLTAIAMAVMQDRGLIKYGTKIAEYWPEFAQNGKEEVTVADLMRHEAGLAAWDTSLDVNDALTENIKKNNIGKVIEKQKLNFPESGKREYHGITRGWIANEIFRRVHPEGETIGEFLQKEIQGPLDANVFVGVNDENANNYAPVTEMGIPFVIGQSMIPSIIGRAVDVNFFELLSFVNMIRKAMQKSGEKKPAFADSNGLSMDKQLGPFFNQEIVRRGETSSANGNCSARGLAVVAAAMANRGNFKGKTILSPTAWEALHADPTLDFLFGDVEANFTQGGVSKFEEPDKSLTLGRDGYYGWLGYGGSVFQWHPEYRVGFAYTPTLLEWYSIDNRKGRLLQGEVIKCVENLREK